MSDTVLIVAIVAMAIAIPAVFIAAMVFGRRFMLKHRSVAVDIGKTDHTVPTTQGPAKTPAVRPADPDLV